MTGRHLALLTVQTCLQKDPYLHMCLKFAQSTLRNETGFLLFAHVQPEDQL